MTKALGFVFFLLAAIVLGLAIANLTAQFGPAGDVAGSASQLGLTTSTTNLRFAMGGQFIAQIVVTGLLAVLGWFLYGSETEQYGYLIGGGLLLVASVVIRLTPLVPMSATRLSPGTFFYGTQVRVQVTADHTPRYVTVPPHRPEFRVAVVAPEEPEHKSVVLLDFGENQQLLRSYAAAPAPPAILGSVLGTRTLARESETFLVPRVKVHQIETGGG